MADPIKTSALASPLIRLPRAALLAAGVSILGSAGVVVTAQPATAQALAGPYLAAEHAARRFDIAEAAHYYGQALAADPSNAVLLERTILHKVAAGQIETAITLSRKLVEQRPESQIALLLMAAEAFKAEDPQGILDMIAEQNAETGSFVSYLIEAWASYALGNHDEARQALEALRDQGTGGAAGEMMATYHLGVLEAALGNDAAAILAFEDTTGRLREATDRLTLFHAGALARGGQQKAALDLVRARLGETLGDARLEALLLDLEAGEVPPPVVRSGAGGAAEALFGISGLLTRGQNRIIGLAYARLATFLEPDLTDAKVLMAQMLSRDAQYDLAIAAYESVPRDAPEALVAQIGRANAMHEAGRVEPAIIAMREVTARFPRSVEAQLALGDILRREKRFAEAAVAYDGAIQLTDPIEDRHWVLYYQRGICYERSDNWELAEADFLRALEMEPDQPQVLNYLGYSWVELRMNIDRAKEMIETAVAKLPDDGYIVDSLGWVHFRLGEFDDAVRHLERAVELRPVDPVINDHFGDALWMVGRRTEARFQWRRALSFEPEPEEEERIQAKLARGLDAVLADEEAAGKPAIITGEPQTESPG
ncbi:MAG: tetratricopeptide repeat protein [Pseudomonadota bacterium]